MTYFFVSGNVFHLFLDLPCRPFPCGFAKKISIFYWIYMSSLSTLVLSFIYDLPHILASTNFTTMLLYFFAMNIKVTEIICFQIETILLVQWKVLEHQLDCLSGRSQEAKINSQFYTEILVNIERDKVCRILYCSNTIYLSAIWPTVKVCGGIELQLHSFLTLSIRMVVQLYCLSAEICRSVGPSAVWILSCKCACRPLESRPTTPGLFSL